MRPIRPSCSPIDTLTLGFLFGFQIYFDFAGYSSIAIGVALLMGIRFPENFAFPYLSDSPRTFWRRWHISLSSWIRDYVYLPLAGVKVADRMSTGGIGIDGTGQIGRNNALFALFATWAIMGLWHGAAWTFVLWGVWHAALVQGHRFISPRLARWRGPLLTVIGWAVTLALVMIGWVPVSGAIARLYLHRLVAPFGYRPSDQPGFARIDLYRGGLCPVADHRSTLCRPRRRCGAPALAGGQRSRGACRLELAPHPDHHLPAPDQPVHLFPVLKAPI